jgi:mannose-6-phosphate isomerase-like protein (cupin superfamily)
VYIRVSNGSFDPSKYDELVALTEDVAARMKNLPGFVSYHGTTISALGSTYTTKTDGQATGGAYSLMEEELWGDPTPLHRHGREEEAFYVMSGRLAVWADGTETIAEPGAFVLIPRGVAHAARRIGDSVQPLRRFSSGGRIAPLHRERRVRTGKPGMSPMDWWGLG